MTTRATCLGDTKHTEGHLSAGLVDMFLDVYLLEDYPNEPQQLPIDIPAVLTDHVAFRVQLWQGGTRPTIRSSFSTYRHRLARQQ